VVAAKEHVLGNKRITSHEITRLGMKLISISSKYFEKPMSPCQVTAEFMSHMLSKEQNISTYARNFKRIKGDRELHLTIITGEVQWVYRDIPETTQKSCSMHDLRKVHSNAKRMLNAFRHVSQKSQKVSIITIIIYLYTSMYLTWLTTN